MALAGIEAFLFALEDVVAPTGGLHAAAWKRVCDDLLSARAQGGAFVPFYTHEDHQRYFAGRPALEGLEAFLNTRGLDLPMGEADDSAGAPTRHGVLAQKRAYFLEEIDREGVAVYPSAVELAELARERGLKTGIVLCGPEGAAVLEAAGIHHLNDLMDNGASSVGASYASRADGFLSAAAGLSLPPERCAVVTDSEAAVEASREQGFGLIIGVGQEAKAQALKQAGADLVVGDLVELLPGGGPPHALACMNAIRGSLQGRRLALFLDYDGTLTPIVDRPEDAALPARTRHVLEKLCDATTVAFVSGRVKEEVRAFVGLDKAVYAGSHGFAIEGPGGLDFIQDEGAAISPIIAEAAQRLETGLADVAGIRIENKHFAVAVHYRQVAPEDLPRVEAAVDQAVSDHPDLYKSGGKKVFELRPRIDWHKGKALLYLLERLNMARDEVIPLYIGDDVTDEDAFEALRGRGIAICVKDRPAPTAAAFRLRDTEEVALFLERLHEAIRPDNGRGEIDDPGV